MKNNREELSGDKLRKAAEERLAEKGMESTSLCGTTEEQKLIYELQVHQIELNLQNEELRNAWQAADELRQQYQTLFDVAPVGYLVLDKDAVILQFNQRATQLLDTTEDHMVGRRLGAFLDQKALAVFNALFASSLSPEFDSPCEFTSTLNNSSLSETHYLHFLGRCIQSGNPHVHCIVSISDISEIHQYQESLREVNKKLHLLSSITRHDIINQVMALSIALEIIRMKRKQDAPIDEELAMCESAHQTIERLIRFTHDYESLGVHKPVWESVRTVVEKVQQKISIPVTSDHSLFALEVYADMMFANVFANLFINAEQHGGDLSRITVSFYQNGPEGILVVEDNGSGIANDMKEKIFDWGVGDGTGTGLGLFHSSDIMGITGISICETGTPGEGARFELHIPAGVWRYGNEKS